MKKTVLLAILDGFGCAEDSFLEGNAIKQAKKPNLDYFWKEYSHSKLLCSGTSVGLPEGQMGNSEVGHLNIGSGRIVYQDLTRINKAIADGSLRKNPVLNEVLDETKKKGKALHFFGLLSDGGVHSHIEHLFELLEIAKEKGLEKVYIHAFLDGRDVSPTSGLGYLKDLQDKLDELGIGELASFMGRYYAMDRDKRWDRIELACDCMVDAKGRKTKDALEFVEKCYQNGETDEFIKPTLLLDESGQAKGLIEDEDTIIFYNFRADRARQITDVFVGEDFEEFPRDKNLENINYVCMTEYEQGWDLPLIFPAMDLENTLGEVLAKEGKKQLRIAETEKYAHVTFFFNGGKEEANENEDRILINSPNVRTYDLKPEMSAYEVTDKIIEKILSQEYDFILLNFANPDMVGHTGVIPAAVKAVEVVDECLGRIYEAMKKIDGQLLITADHGNAESMLDEHSHKPITSHSSNRVPFIHITFAEKKANLRDGSLRDISPTILDLLNIKKPEEMTGTSLLTD